MINIIHITIRLVCIAVLVQFSAVAAQYNQDYVIVAAIAIIVFESIYYRFRHKDILEQEEKSKKRAKEELEETRSRGEKECQRRISEAEQEIQQMKSDVSWEIEATKKRLAEKNEKLDLLLASGQVPKVEFDGLLKKYNQTAATLEKSIKRNEQLEHYATQLSSQFETTKEQLETTKKELETEQESNANLRLQLESWNRKLKDQLWLMTRRVELISTKLDMSDIAKNDIEFWLKKEAHKHSIQYEPIDGSGKAAKKKEATQQDCGEETDQSNDYPCD